MELKPFRVTGVHHIAIICRDIEASIKFYIEVLGCRMVRQEFRETRDSWKVDLELAGQQMIELFTFPDSPARASYPEACGLRHLALKVNDLDEVKRFLQQYGVAYEEERVDEASGERFFFLRDPDGLPIEIVEVK
jgi:glyoxylase I family protein